MKSVRFGVGESPRPRLADVGRAPDADGGRARATEAEVGREAARESFGDIDARPVVATGGGPPACTTHAAIGCAEELLVGVRPCLL